MRDGRANGCHYFPRWLTALWLSAGIAALFLSGACHRGAPVVDSGTNTVTGATLTGIVRGPEGRVPVPGREVRIVNAETGERHTAQTERTGGFAIHLPAGKYRLEVPLRDGETLVKRPGVVDLGNAGAEAPVEFVVATARVVRPRGPAYRLDNGLGSPIT